MARTKKTEESKIEEPKIAKKDCICAVGRRREAVARVRIYSEKNSLLLNEMTLKKGDIIVNNLPIEKYFGGEVAKATYLEPLRITNTLNKFIVTIRILGGGKSGQLEAVVHGLSRALSELDRASFRPVLKKRGFLTRDSRTRERRKVGMGGKARRKRQSPKR